eukprot:1149687-Pelagomonas_calceolata.AAC.5
MHRDYRSAPPNTMVLWGVPKSKVKPHIDWAVATTKPTYRMVPVQFKARQAGSTDGVTYPDLSVGMLTFICAVSPVQKQVHPGCQRGVQGRHGSGCKQDALGCRRHGLLRCQWPRAPFEREQHAAAG